MSHRETARVDYDAELRLHDAALRRASEIEDGDRVLDVGCGAGQTTRDAARAAREGGAFGVDISREMIDRARSLSEAEGIRNVAFEVGDAQEYPLAPERADVAISRFGTMFFREPVTAFSNIAQGIRPGGRLVMMVWQAHERNEWSVSIERALAAVGSADPTSKAPDPFSLADPETVRGILAAAGYSDIAFTDVDEPVFYGQDLPAALEWVRGFAGTTEVMGRLDPPARERALGILREMLAAHARDGGIWFESRAWIVRARRRS